MFSFPEFFTASVCSSLLYFQLFYFTLLPYGSKNTIVITKDSTVYVILKESVLCGKVLCCVVSEVLLFCVVL